MKRTARHIVSVLLMFVLVFAFTGCGAALKEAAKLESYALGDESVPSITSVVGEREVTGVESSTNNGIASKQYTYASASVYDDLWAYVQTLMDDGWLVTQDIDLKDVPGSGQLGKKSAQDGQILLISFSYEDAAYVIKVSKAKGTIE